MGQYEFQSLSPSHFLQYAKQWYHTLDRSLIVSVLPMPSGPTGTPHWWDRKAMVRVRKHLCVKGVTTRRGVGPRYS